MDIKLECVSHPLSNGPFFLGMIRCDHKVYNESCGMVVVMRDHCPLCKGTGWKNVPCRMVVVDKDDKNLELRDSNNGQ